MGEARWLVAVVIGLVGLAGGVQAQERWSGAWLVEGTTERVYLDPTADGLVLERTVPSPDRTSVWDFELRGASRGARAELEGTVRIGDERQPARLQAARVAERTLEVTLLAGAEVVRHERWVRPGPATLAARVLGGGDVTPDGVILRTEHATSPLELELLVGGRPQALLLTIAAVDSGVYPKHDDLVVWQPLRARRVDPADDMIDRGAEPVDARDERFVDEEQVPVGTHRQRWDGRDRIAGEPLRPGTYRLVVASLDAPIGPAAGEADCAPVVLTLHVLPAEFEVEPEPEVEEARTVAAEVKRPRVGGYVRRAGR
jgi:hypothetical protein